MNKLILLMVVIATLLFQGCNAIDLSTDNSKANSNNSTTSSNTTNNTNGNSSSTGTTGVMCNGLTGTNDSATVTAKVLTSQYSMDFTISVGAVTTTAVVQNDGTYYTINQTIILADNNGTAINIPVKLLDGNSLVVTEGTCSQPAI